jgi:DNA-binding MarR family transcriptional regulator
VTIKTNIEDAEWISKVLRTLDAFRKVNQNVTANQMAVFLHIALQPGITQRELSDRTGLDDGTVSRIVAILSDRGAGERAGMDLINIGAVPGDYRKRSHTQTTQGKRLLNTIREINNG